MSYSSLSTVYPEQPDNNAKATRLFIFAFFGGAVVIGLGEVLSLGSGETDIGIHAMGILCPLLIMLLYYLEANKLVRKSRTVSLEQVADSLYFLGFLYTLCALLAALISLSEIDTANIVSRFGLALVTTIVGLFAKTALTQFMLDEDVVIDQAKDGLSSAINELAETLNSATNRVNDFVSDSHERFCGGTEQCIDALKTHTSQCADALQSHMDDSISKQRELTNSCIDEVICNTQKAMSTLDNSALDSTEKVSSDYKDMVSNAIEQRKEMDKLINRTGEISMKSINDIATCAEATYEKLGEKTVATNNALNGLTEALQSTADAQHAIVSRLSDMDATLNESTCSRMALNEANKKIAKLSETLSEGIQSIVEISAKQDTVKEDNQTPLVHSMQQMMEQWRMSDLKDRELAEERLHVFLDSITTHLVEGSGKSLAASRELQTTLKELISVCEPAVRQRPTWWR